MKFKFHHDLFVVLIISFNQSLSAQKTPKNASTKEIEKYNATYKDEKVLVYEASNQFIFSFNVKNETIEVDEQIVESYLNLSDIEQKVVGYDFYSNFSSIEDVKGSKARTERGKMKVNGIFHHDMYYLAYFFEQPAGTKIQTISYSKKHYDARYLATAYFQMQYPVKERHLIFEFPSLMDIELVEENFDGFNIEKTLKTEGNSTIIEYVIQDLEPFFDYKNAPGRSHTYPHILILTKEVKNEDGSSRMIVMRNTQDQYNWYKNLLESANNDNSSLKSKVNEIAEGQIDSLIIMQLLFDWVQDNINYIAYEDGISGFQPESCQDVFYNRYGDCKGMANLLTEMLRIAGIDARMTWIGTNDIAYDYSIPSLAVDNHAICTANIDNKFYYLDPTEKFVGIDQYAERIQGRPALIENGDEYLIKNVPLLDYEENLNKTVMAFEINDDLLIGSIEAEYNGESNRRLMYAYNSIYDSYKEKAINYLVISGDNNIHVESIEIENLDKKGKTIKLLSQVNIENKISEFGDKLYVDWDLYKEFSDYTIDSTRTIDFVFKRKVYEINEVHLKTPDQFTISNLPENFDVKNDDFQLQLKFDYSEENNSLFIRKEIVIPEDKIAVKNFAKWNESIEKLNNDYYKTALIYEKN